LHVIDRWLEMAVSRELALRYGNVGWSAMIDRWNWKVTALVKSSLRDIHRWGGPAGTREGLLPP
jgi:hypothetical protein